MDFLIEIWGKKDEIGPLETMERATVMFLSMLLMLRLTGMRSFSKGSVFDNVVLLLLGAVVARGVVGGTPFFSALLGGIWLILIHKFLSRFTFFNRWAGKLVKGEPLLLYKDGAYYEDNMRHCDITRNDIAEELRLSLQKNSMNEIEEVYRERSGKISFVKKPSAE